MTDEELKVRKEEEKLFSDISRPPTILASMTDVLNDDSSPKDDLKKSSTSRSKKRERDS